MKLFKRKGKNLFFFLSLLLISGATGCSVEQTNTKMKENLKAPIAKKINKELIQHGDVRIDPYYWLNDRTDSEVIDYLTKENAYDNKTIFYSVKDEADRAGNLEYSFDHKNDKFYIITNYKAKNFRLMETDLDKTSLKNWKEVIPNREDVLLEDVELFNDYMVLSERKNGITNIRVISDDGSDHYIDFGEKAYLAYTSTNIELLIWNLTLAQHD